MASTCLQYCTVQYSAVQYSTVRAYMPALTLLRVNRFSQVIEINCPNSKIKYPLKTNSIREGSQKKCKNLVFDHTPLNPPPSRSTPQSTLYGVNVTGAASLVAECGTNILFKKHQKSLFGTLPKISDWIRKYVQICHGF